MNVAQQLMERGRRAQLDRSEAKALALAPGTTHSGRGYGAAINADVLGHHEPADPERSASALRSIPADTGREEWLRASFAARAAGVSSENFLQWCRTGGDKFTGDEDALKAWNSFDPDRAQGIGAGTLYMMARARGWQDTRGISAIASSGAGVVAQAANDEGHEQATDLWLAGYFARQSGTAFRYDHSVKQWRTYSGGSWAPCRKGEHMEAMKGLAGLLMQECGKLLISNPKGRDIKKLTACAQRAQSVQGIEAALKLAQSDPALAISADELDTDPDLLNVANGVVYLPTGTLTAHDPAQMLYRQSPVPFDAEAACPEFMKFMGEVSCGDAGWVEFMQLALGYSISGHVSEEKLFFWLGNGANGKSVLANIVRHLMGTYGVTALPAFLMQSRRDGASATPELVMLVGARTAFVNETEAGSRLSGATVKNAVSTEAMTVRPLYGAAFTFKPTHKLLVRGNHRPIVTEGDEGIWRRIVLVPFDLNVAPQGRDPGLEARLLAEAPGILRWLVEGYVKWKCNGLKIPKRVTEASHAYRKESDLLEQWISEQCERGVIFSIPQRDAYRNYQRWCVDQGLRSFSKASFTRSLTERGFGTAREGSGARRETYTGFRLT